MAAAARRRAPFTSANSAVDAGTYIVKLLVGGKVVGYKTVLVENDSLM